MKILIGGLLLAGAAAAAEPPAVQDRRQPTEQEREQAQREAQERREEAEREVQERREEAEREAQRRREQAEREAQRRAEEQRRREAAGRGEQGQREGETERERRERLDEAEATGRGNERLSDEERLRLLEEQQRARRAERRAGQQVEGRGTAGPGPQGIVMRNRMTEEFRTYHHRAARLERIRDVLRDAGREQQAERAQAAMRRERERHEAAMERFRGSLGAEEYQAHFASLQQAAQEAWSRKEAAPEGRGTGPGRTEQPKEEPR